MSKENMPSAESADDQGQNGGEGMGGSSSSSNMKTIIIVVVVLIVVGALYAVVKTSRNAPEDIEEPEAAASADQTGAAANTPAASANEAGLAAGAVITFTEAGYAPALVTIKQGDAVTFKNESSTATWPASAMHPTHTVYPGSDIQKCGTAEQAGIFDACRGLNTGESWSFQFNEKGSWNYHDHLNPTKFGTIVVE